MKKIVSAIMILCVISVGAVFVTAMPKEKPIEEIVPVHMSGILNFQKQEGPIEFSVVGYEYTDKAQMLLDDIDVRHLNKPCLVLDFVAENFSRQDYDFRLREANAFVNKQKVSFFTETKLDLQADSAISGRLYIFSDELKMDELLDINLSWISYSENILGERIDHNMSIDINI